MMRFLVFLGSDYYPWGGWRDFHASYDSADEAVAALRAMEMRYCYQDKDWWHVVDSETSTVVRSGGWDDSAAREIGDIQPFREDAEPWWENR